MGVCIGYAQREGYTAEDTTEGGPGKQLINTEIRKRMGKKNILPQVVMLQCCQVTGRCCQVQKWSGTVLLL